MSNTEVFAQYQGYFAPRKPGIFNRFIHFISIEISHLQFLLSRGKIKKHNQIFIHGADKSKAKLFLGMIPHGDSSKKYFSANNIGLVISANEAFELAGVGTYRHVLSRAELQVATGNGIDTEFHHLNFRDFATVSNTLPVIDTLRKLLNSYNDGKNIYIHCKAGKARSALIVLLFMALSDHRFKQKLSTIKKNTSELTEQQIKQQLEELLCDIQKHVRVDRPQIGVGSKIKTGVEVLHYMITQGILSNDESHNFQISDPINTALTDIHQQNKLKAIRAITQSEQIKDLVDYAFSNDKISQVNIILGYIYNNPESLCTISNIVNNEAVSLDSKHSKLVKAIKSFVTPSLYARLVSFFTRKNNDTAKQLLFALINRCNTELNLYLGGNVSDGSGVSSAATITLRIESPCLTTSLWGILEHRDSAKTIMVTEGKISPDSCGTPQAASSNIVVQPELQVNNSGGDNQFECR